MCHFGVKAQKVLHGIGPNISLLSYREKTESSFTSDGAIYVCFAYSPRINLFEKKNFSVSAGLPMHAGVMVMISDHIEGFLVSVPAVINLNWGAGSTTRSMEKMGCFVGAGAGYLYRNAVEYDRFAPINGLAGTINTGIRIGVGRYRNKNVEIKWSCTLPAQNSTPIWGAHALFTHW